jgi:hypothetical protein
MDTVTKEKIARWWRTSERRKSCLRQVGVEFSKALTDAGLVGYEMEETEEELMKQLKEITDE